MEIFIYIIVFVMVLVGILSLIYNYRNNKTYKFMNEVNDLCYYYNIRRIDEIQIEKLEYDNAYKWFMSQIDYNKVLFSTKSIKLESFFSAEDIKKIKS